MTVLLIWLGETHPLYEWRTMCIRRVKEVYPDAKFKVITKLKSFFNMEIIHPDSIPVDVDTSKYIMYSDYARLWYLANNENTLYIDTDTWCDKAYSFTDKMASNYFEAIWSGKECDKIKSLIPDNTEKTMLYKLGSKLDGMGESLKEYCTHKPLWAKKYRQIA